jgi:pimeloyl-ACP methyl ester carboxylesterase
MCPSVTTLRACSTHLVEWKGRSMNARVLGLAGAYARVCIGLLALASGDAHAQLTASTTGELAAEAIERAGNAVRTEHVVSPGWIWTQLEVHDETYPLTVDIVASTASSASKVIYLIPGGGATFEGSYLTPRAENLSQFFLEQGYLVVGITARASTMPATVTNHAFAAGWGLAKHRSDVRSIVERIQPALDLPYEVLGHSYGASIALDYASKHAAEMARVIALDIYSIDPARDPRAIRDASATYAAHVLLLAQGIFLDPAGAALPLFASWSDAERVADSGVPRIALGYPGNFTNESWFYYTQIYSSQMPSLHTLLTGLTGDWPLIGSMFAGAYRLALDARRDEFSFTNVERSTLLEATTATPNGLFPIALARDYWAVTAGNPAYTIDWAAIACKLVWLNTELGYAAQSHGAALAQQAGNRDVVVDIVPGYGHNDILLGRNARSDAWSRIR